MKSDSVSTNLVTLFLRCDHLNVAFRSAKVASANATFAEQKATMASLRRSCSA